MNDPLSEVIALLQPRAAPVVASQSLTVLSSDPDAISLPSGENATALTEPEWPLSVCK